jgi:ubiquinone biosynthesis protein UbiJ
MSLDSRISLLIAQVANRVLDAEPWAKGQLAAHAGKSFAVQLAPFALQFAIESDGRLTSGDASPDVTIRLAPQALFSQGPERLKHVRIEGEAALAHALSDVAQQVRPDPEQALSGVVGDIAARRISQGVQVAFDALRAQGRRLADNAVEYVAHEDPLILARAPHEAFAADVRLLRDQLERVGKRVELLERRV